MKERKAEKSNGGAAPEAVAAEVLVLERLTEMARFLRLSKKQPPEVSAAAAKYEVQFSRDLEQLKAA